MCESDTFGGGAPTLERGDEREGVLLGEAALGAGASGAGPSRK